MQTAIYLCRQMKQRIPVSSFDLQNFVSFVFDGIFQRVETTSLEIELQTSEKLLLQIRILTP